MAGAIQLTEVDFEQIKLNLIDYLKSTKEFTDYDFEGSNLQVILNLISYQAQLNAYSTNMIANESFLASASIRDNVVLNANTLGYLPISARASSSKISFSFQLQQNDFPAGYPTSIEILPGAIFSTSNGLNSFIFNFIDVQTAPVNNNGLVSFLNREIYEGFYLKEEFTVNTSNFNQEFILQNTSIDTTTILVEVQENPNEEYNTFYQQANDLTKVSETSRVYWIEETNNEYYKLTFGDGYFGYALKNGAKITVSYLRTSGSVANGIQGVNNFNFSSSRVVSSTGVRIVPQVNVSAVSISAGGAEIESVESIKFRAPKNYGAQNRAVIASDYSTLVRSIYPAVDAVYVYGGEELEIPEYGRVFIAIKPSTGDALSTITKNYIKESLNDYRIASLDIILTDADILFVELDSAVFYDDKLTIKDASGINSSVVQTLSDYAVSESVSKFGGAVRFSHIVCAIDNSEQSITRNNTVLRMRKDITAIRNAPTSYEICFKNALKLNTNQSVIYSTGFQLINDGKNDGRTYYFEDDTKGNVYSFYLDAAGTKIVTNTTFGTVDYEKGEIMLGYSTPIIIANTIEPNSGISIRGVPAGQDIVAKQSVYLQLDVATSKINSIIDTNMLST